MQIFYEINSENADAAKYSQKKRSGHRLRLHVGELQFFNLLATEFFFEYFFRDIIHSSSETHIDAALIRIFFNDTFLF